MSTFTLHAIGTARSDSATRRFAWAAPPTVAAQLSDRPLNHEGKEGNSWVSSMERLAGATARPS